MLDDLNFLHRAVLRCFSVVYAKHFEILLLYKRPILEYMFAAINIRTSDLFISLSYLLNILSGFRLN